MKKKVALINNVGQWVLVFDQAHQNALRPDGDIKPDFEKKIFFGMIEEALIHQVTRDKSPNSAWAIPTITGMILFQAFKDYPWQNQTEGMEICTLLNPDIQGIYG